MRVTILVLAVNSTLFQFLRSYMLFSSRLFLCALAFTLLQIFVWQQVTSRHFSALCFFCFIFALYNTRPHLCVQPCKQGEWGEWVHFPYVSPPFGFWRYSQLGCVTQNAKWTLPWNFFRDISLLKMLNALYLTSESIFTPCTHAQRG